MLKILWNLFVKDKYACTSAHANTHTNTTMSIGQLYGLRCCCYRDQRRYSQVSSLYSSVKVTLTRCFLRFCVTPLSSISATQENGIVERGLSNLAPTKELLRKICYSRSALSGKCFLTSVCSLFSPKESRQFIFLL